MNISLLECDGNETLFSKDFHAACLAKLDPYFLLRYNWQVILSLLLNYDFFTPAFFINCTGVQNMKWCALPPTVKIVIHYLE